jgi:MFS family permease
MTYLTRKYHSVFYGWWIVGACFLINVCVSGTVNFGFTAFFEPIANEFGWSYAQVSLAASLRGIEMGLLAPVAGLMVDRYGPRRLVFGGAILIGLGLTLLSRTNDLAMFYGSFALITMGVSTCMGVVLMAAIAHWFRRKASIAIGIAASGGAIGGLMVPLATTLIDTFGWRMAIFSLGLGVCGLVMILSLLLRHKPEQYGYLPDGEVESFQITDQPANTTQTPDTEPKMGARQVLVSRTFWHMAVSFMGCILVVTAVVTHVMPYLSSIGIARETSSLLASAMTAVTIFGRVGFGWFGDKFDKRRLTTITVILIGLGMLLFGFITSGSIWLALPFIIFFSIGWGGNAIMMAVMVGAYFGRSSFGTVLGFVMGASIVGQILGAPLAGWVFDTWGSYQGVWFGYIGLLFVAMIAIATTPPVTTGTRVPDKR